LQHDALFQPRWYVFFCVWIAANEELVRSLSLISGIVVEL
jgi:hypothetical protein